MKKSRAAGNGCTISSAPGCTTPRSWRNAVVGETAGHGRTVLDARCGGEPICQGIAATLNHFAAYRPGAGPRPAPPPDRLLFGLADCARADCCAERKRRSPGTRSRWAERFGAAFRCQPRTWAGAAQANQPGRALRGCCRGDREASGSIVQIGDRQRVQTAVQPGIEAGTNSRWSSACTAWSCGSRPPGPRPAATACGADAGGVAAARGRCATASQLASGIEWRQLADSLAHLALAKFWQNVWPW